VRYRRVGNTGLTVSELGIGTWSLVMDWWGADVNKAEEILREAYKEGITFFDTADLYGKGRGEELLGKVLTTVRDKVIILTKIGYDFYSGDTKKQNFSPEYLEKALSLSLSRLNTDYIDVLMIHNPRMSVIQSKEVRDTLEGFRRDGKARVVGVALGPTLGWREEGLKAIEMNYQALEHIFSLIEREPGLDFLKSQIGHFVRVPHASDVLDEERWYTFGNVKMHRALKDSKWLSRALECARELKEKLGIPLHRLALKYVLSEKNVSSVIPNITSKADVRRFKEDVESPDLDDYTLQLLNDFYHAKFKELNRESEEETVIYK